MHASTLRAFRHVRRNRGVIAEHILACVHRADFAQLQAWFQRGATAPSLEAVVADEP